MIKDKKGAMVHSENKLKLNKVELKWINLNDIKITQRMMVISMLSFKTWLGNKRSSYHL